MSGEKPRVTLGSNEPDPSYTDPAEIAKSREELLAMDTDGKLTIAPNQENRGDLEMWKIQLFEPRDELGGTSAYNYFDKIIFGHGEGPEDTDQRTFKNADNLSDEYHGTIGEIKEQLGATGKKILTVVCGTDEEHKMTLTKAIREYLSK